MSELPPVVAKLWERETATRRGPRPRLDLATVTAAAVELADAEGLAGVSMAGVAARVGVAPMALYRYVGSKDELLTLMSDAAAPPPPERGTLPWRAYLATWTRANRDLLLARPWLLTLPGQVPPIGPRRLAWLEAALAALGETPLDGGEKFRAATTLTGYALSDATLTHAVSAANSQLAAAGIDGAAGYGELLAEVLDPMSYPVLSATLQTGVLGASEGWVEDADFTFGLDLLLDGIEVLIANRERKI
jgi:AcrR family transcriptional regulator